MEFLFIAVSNKKSELPFMEWNMKAGQSLIFALFDIMPTCNGVFFTYRPCDCTDSSASARTQICFKETAQKVVLCKM